jgi:cold-inducible RNA-binding protein
MPKIIQRTVEMKCVTREPGRLRMEVVAVDGAPPRETFTMYIPLAKGKTMKRAYVGNIPFTTTAEELRAWLAPLKIDEINIIFDHNTKRPRGFAFVEFSTVDDFEKALWQFNGQQLGGRTIVVNDATEKRRGVR